MKAHPSVGVVHVVAARGNTIAAGQFCFEKMNVQVEVEIIE